MGSLVCMSLLLLSLLCVCNAVRILSVCGCLRLWHVSLYERLFHLWNVAFLVMVLLRFLLLTQSHTQQSLGARWDVGGAARGIDEILFFEKLFLYFAIQKGGGGRIGPMFDFGRVT